MDAFAFHQFHQFFGQGIACAQVDEVVGSDLYGAACHDEFEDVLGG